MEPIINRSAAVAKRLSSLFGRIRLEYLYLTITIPFSIATMLLTPPLQVPDGTQHFYRSWGLSTGQIFCEPGSIVSIPEGIRNFADTFATGVSDDGLFRLPMLRDWDRTTTLSGPETAVYTQFCSYDPLAHLPQTAGILLARAAHPSTAAVHYGAEIANVLVAILLVFLAIRLTPFGKTYFFLAGLGSGAIEIFSSVSGDAISIGGLLFLSALFLRAADGRTLSPRNLAALLAASLLFIHAKPAYIAFTLLVLIIPAGRFPSRRTYFAFLATFFAANILLTLFLASYADPESYLRPAGIDPAAQVSFMKAHPTDTLLLVARDTVSNLPRYIGVKKN